MSCEEYQKGKCKGKFWCGRCEKSGYPPTNDTERFAMTVQRELFKECQNNKDNFDKFVGYYSAIQVLENALRGYYDK